MKVVFLAIFLLILNSCTEPSIVGIWINEEDTNQIWEFKGSGRLVEKYGEIENSFSSSYEILNRTQSCSSGSTDATNETYLKIEDPELGTFCYYLETLSDEFFVIIDTETGRMLIFNKVI